ncbi:MAG: hypothetical protein ABW164_07135 [Sphingobium sp.]
MRLTRHVMVATTLLLTGCGDRQGSIDAATVLADAVYPGQLELFDTHMMKGQYAVTFARKGDAFSRVRLVVDRDPAKCRVGTHCEARLRTAYVNGTAAGAKLKALAATLPPCGIAILSVDASRLDPSFRTDIELDMDPSDQQPALDRLSTCIAAFRAALPADATSAQQDLSLGILLPRPGRVTPPDPAPSFEKTLNSSRADEPRYLTFVKHDETQMKASALRLHPYYLFKPEIRDRLAARARDVLSAQHLPGHIQHHVQFHDTRLDPQRLEILRTYVLACSIHDPGEGPCKTDLAVRMRYDMKTGEVTEAAILRDVRDERGSLRLPPLPGR